MLPATPYSTNSSAPGPTSSTGLIQHCCACCSCCTRFTQTTTQAQHRCTITTTNSACCLANCTPPRSMALCLCDCTLAQQCHNSLRHAVVFVFAGAYGILAVAHTMSNDRTKTQQQLKSQLNEEPTTDSTPCSFRRSSISSISPQVYYRKPL